MIGVRRKRNEGGGSRVSQLFSFQPSASLCPMHIQQRNGFETVNLCNGGQIVHSCETKDVYLKGMTQTVEIEDLCQASKKKNICRQLRFMAFFISHLYRPIVTPGNNGTAQNLSLLLFSIKKQTLNYPNIPQCPTLSLNEGVITDVNGTTAQLLQKMFSSETQEHNPF